MKKAPKQNEPDDADEFQAVHRRVTEQMDLVASVSAREATMICLAHIRYYARFIGRSAAPTKDVEALATGMGNAFLNEAMRYRKKRK